MASRELTVLHPAMRPLVDRWLSACPVEVLIYCTVREPWEQAALYAVGRTADQIASGVARLEALGLESHAALLRKQEPKAGRRVTNAMPGFSFHHGHWVASEYGGLALDFVPTLGGKPRWSDAAAYEKAGAAAEAVGLTWSGRWVQFRETAHVQYDDGGKIKMLPLVQGAYR